MAHEIMESDNIFSVKEVPWHGLGVILDSPPTITEALDAANLRWKVSLLPLFCQIPMDHSDNSRRTSGIFYEVQNRAVLREDTREILGTVGGGYEVLQNEDAFKIFEPLVESKNILLETAGSLKNGRRVWILARINTEGAEITKGDEIKPYVLLSNSHDGTMAVRFGFTPIRVVCHNTLSMAESADTSKLIRMIHTQGIYQNLETVRDVMDLSKASFSATIEQYKWLASRNISVADLDRYIKIVFDPEFEKKITIMEEAVDVTLTPSQKKVVQLFETGRGSDLPGRGTWWRAYNAVNEYLMYERGRNADNRINSAWFADGYNFNQAALNTALRLAA